MSISIVTITYNSSSHIGRLLESLSLQDYKGKLEVIIIDNNSKDKLLLRKTITDLTPKLKKLSLKLISKTTNLGFAASCNYGAKLSKYKYLLFLNPDVILENNSISILLKHLSLNNADIAGGKSIYMDSMETHRTVFNTPTIWDMLFEFSNLGKIFKISSSFYVKQEGIDSDIPVDGVGGAYFLIKRKCFDSLGGFDQKFFMYLEDIDICTRARENFMKIIYCPHSLIRHMGGGSSQSKHRIVHKAWFDSREYYSRKYNKGLLGKAIRFLYKNEKHILELRRNIKSL